MNFHDPKSKTTKPFSTVDLVRKTSDVLHAATQRPVVLTKTGKPRFVLMSVETFAQLNPRKVFKTNETPPEIAEWLLPQLEAFSKGKGEATAGRRKSKSAMGIDRRK